MEEPITGTINRDRSASRTHEFIVLIRSQAQKDCTVDPCCPEVLRSDRVTFRLDNHIDNLLSHVSVRVEERIPLLVAAEDKDVKCDTFYLSKTTPDRTFAISESHQDRHLNKPHFVEVTAYFTDGAKPVSVACVSPCESDGSDDGGAMHNHVRPRMIVVRL